MQVGQDLDFDVPGPFDQFLQVHARVAEGRLGFGLSLRHGRLQRQVVAGHPHAFAAAAGGRLDQHGEADFVSDLGGLVLVVDQALAAGHHRHAGRPGHPAGRVLVAQHLHGFRRGADEVDVATAADLVEMRVLGQEAVAGMNRLDVAHFGGADDPVDLQVALALLAGPTQ